MSDSPEARLREAMKAGEYVEFAGNIMLRVDPMPGEVWATDRGPAIIVARTAGRVSYVVPCAGAPGYRETYCGSDYTFAERGWTLLWRPGVPDA